ncbi:ABC transporter ATP-binding protein [Rhizobium sp. L1K21]|uniref:ABC transporter ATP-binding protein n=1 Tax=Rhizobium sp. L1K21 TaxID=2954933 RepID=UPI0020936F43|nr:ABC transporter ATP-binding protein [Rhizobium sp. L1K21]MCO6188359.1 ABC transporter ATP-binding protein [Rhizobium sp. L1K21]
MAASLEVIGFDTFYGQSQALREFSIRLEGGKVLCLLGRNGAGKTTALKSIMGIIPPRKGKLLIDGNDLSEKPAYEIPKHGIGYVPQGRRLFSELTVRENLEIGLLTRSTGKQALEHALSYFPVLRERINQVSGTLSGGEQTMLAIARALCIEPSVLMLDEPTEGLMPSAIAAIRDVVIKLRDEGKAILLVEQRVDAVIPVADTVAFMDHGEIRETVAIDVLKDNPALLQKYVGV